MQYSKLPSKSELTFFEVQLYLNEGAGKGTAKKVLWITYAARDYKRQHVKFDLTADREIYRKVKTHMGEEASAAIKIQVRALKTIGIQTMFGMRNVPTIRNHLFKPGQKFYQRELDRTNTVFAFASADGFQVEFDWEGEKIEVSITQHAKFGGNPKQSWGVGYFNNVTDLTELAAYMEAQREATEFKRITEHAEERDSETNDGEIPCTVSQTGSDAGRSSRFGLTEAESSRSDSKGRTSIPEQGKRSDSETSDEQLARVSGIGSTNSVGGNHKGSTANAKASGRSGAARNVRRGKACDDNPFAGTAFDISGLVDQQQESPFFDKFVECDTDLGTSIRF